MVSRDIDRAQRDKYKATGTSTDQGSGLTLCFVDFSDMALVLRTLDIFSCLLSHSSLLGVLVFLFFSVRLFLGFRLLQIIDHGLCLE